MCFMKEEDEKDNNHYLTKAIRIFDEILKIDEYRVYAYQVIVKSGS